MGVTGWLYLKYLQDFLSSCAALDSPWGLRNGSVNARDAALLAPLCSALPPPAVLRQEANI